MRVLLAGGGSAGHTSPLLATAEALRRLHGDVEIIAVGTARGLETTLVPAAGYQLELIPPVPLPRRPNADLLRLPGRLASATAAARALLSRLQPAVVGGFGGYVCVPMYLACRRDRVPLVLHEGNALPGIANRVGARWCADVVATSFPDTPLPHAQFIGLPIRRSISTLDRPELRPLARAHFGLHQDLPTLLVTGGSQGASRINEAVSGAAGQLRAAGIQVLHIAGAKNAVTVHSGAADAPYVVVPFVERMELAYAAADLLIGRAGANTVTEAAALGLPAVFVPLPIGNGEQARNAAAVVAAGGAVVVSNSDFTPEWVQQEIPALLLGAQRLARMSDAAAHLIGRDADDALANLILKAAE